MNPTRACLALVVAAPLLCAARAEACQPVCMRWEDAGVITFDGGSETTPALTEGTDAGTPRPPQPRCEKWGYPDEGGGCSTGAGLQAAVAGVWLALRRRRPAGGT